MMYKVKVFTGKQGYEEFLKDHPNINIVSVNVTSYEYKGVQTRIYLTYYENEWYGMKEFTLVERTEPFTFKEVIDFIDDTNISKMDACELKSRIVDVIQAERKKAIDEFAEKLKKYEYGRTNGVYIGIPIYIFDEIAEQLKGGSDDGK